MAILLELNLESRTELEFYNVEEVIPFFFCGISNPMSNFDVVEN